MDDKKTAKDFNEFRTEYELSPEADPNMTYEDFCVLNADNINRALDYIAREDKIGGYISGYLCMPETCEEDFRITKVKNLKRVGKRLSDDQGNYFYHIIQSFPEGLDISDEEVHRCGVELVERLGLYQAVIASHIHPAVDEEGEVRGRCKHNHILLNSHRYYEFVDEDNPYKMKYNSCKESYAQLQLINDQIAVEHGLPIIEKQDTGKVYSWYEAKETVQGTSWKNRVRLDISNAMRGSEDLDSYLASMTAAGYQMRIGNSNTNGKYITYTCTEGQKVRDYILGQDCKISELEKYWESRNILNAYLAETDRYENRLAVLLEKTQEPLFIKFEKSMSDKRKKVLHDKNLNIRKSYTNYLPLISHQTHSGAEHSYFVAEEPYEIVNEEHRVLAAVTGGEILEYFKLARERERLEKEEEEKLRREKQTRAFYSDSRFRNSTTDRPYRIGLYDETGEERTLIELIVILAITVIDKENGKQADSVQGNTYQHIYAKKDEKIQSMYDSIRIAREENIGNPKELEERLNHVGKELSKVRASIRHLERSRNSMEVVLQAIEGTQELEEICRTVQETPDGPEKEDLQKQYAEEIEEYRMFKSTMYRHGIDSEENIRGIRERYEEVRKGLTYAEEQERLFRERYQKLCKLRYQIQLAQNRSYCYGYLIDEHETKQPEKQTRNETSLAR